MEPLEFYKHWEALQAERQRLTARRDEIEMELHETKTKIRHIDIAMEHLMPLADMGMFVSEITQLGLTDAVRRIMQMNKDVRLGATDVRNKLKEQGYDTSGLTAPMASIYKILSRLSENPEEMRREKEEGRVYYTWIADFLPF
jgi:hypothetical protein